jgi:hypothetical protein
MIEPIGGEAPRLSASAMPLRLIAWLAANRTRTSCQGDFGSAWSSMHTAGTHWPPEGTRRSPGVRLISSAIGPVIR